MTPPPRLLAHDLAHGICDDHVLLALFDSFFGFPSVNFLYKRFTYNKAHTLFIQKLQSFDKSGKHVANIASGNGIVETRIRKVQRNFFIGIIYQSLLNHKLVYNGGFSNFELPLLVRNSTYAPKFCVALVTR